MAYAAKMDEMVKKLGNIECIKAGWMVHNYAKLLQQFVNEQSNEITTPPPLSSKRSAAEAALDLSLSPVKSAKMLPPSAKEGHQTNEGHLSRLRRCSPVKGSLFEPPMKDNELQKSITYIQDLGKKLATSYSVLGKVLISMPEVQIIDTRNGKQLPQFRYVIGDSTGVVEVTKIGPQSYSLMQRVHGLHNEAVVLSKAAWNDERRQLQHGGVTDLQPTQAMADQLEDVQFPVHDDYSELPRLAKWTRVSVHGFICDPGASVINEQDGRKGKGWVRDSTIANMRCQGMNLRIVHQNEDDLEFFAEGVPIMIKYAKTFTGGVYADLHDLSHIDTSNADLAALCPAISSVKRIPWN